MSAPTTPDEPQHGPGIDLRKQLVDDVHQLAWRWARQAVLQLDPDQPPHSVHDTGTDEQIRAGWLALLSACEQIRGELENRARTAARMAAGRGADYAELGTAIGMTRQGARRRWPGLAELAQAARDADLRVLLCPACGTQQTQAGAACPNCGQQQPLADADYNYT